MARFRLGRFVLALTLGAAVLMLFGAASCDEPPLIESGDVQLLPPPEVPAHVVRGSSHVMVHLEIQEKQIEIAPGVTYTAWTFNGTIPGPLIRVRQGDQVEIHLKNPATSMMTHNIDLHAVNGPGGGAGATTVAPGEEKSFTFEAKAPGLFVYHCASGFVADHIANGMYGGILVEPLGGLPSVTREYYIGQNEFYTSGDTGAKGQQDLDTAKLFDEAPTYVTFNGNTKSLIAENALQANVGDTVRIYVVNGGPNLISSFHVIGEIFDKAYEYGSLDRPLTNIQTILVPPGGATVAEFHVDVPGDYKLVDHAIERVSKGAVGTLHANGAENVKMFHPLSPGVNASSHDMNMPTPSGSGVPASASTAVAAPAAGAITVTMRDFSFTPNQLTAEVGKKLVLTLPNAGTAAHNLRIADANGSYDSKESVVSSPELINARKTGTFEWTPLKPGTYKFRCDFHPDQMTGTIVVH